MKVYDTVNNVELEAQIGKETIQKTVKAPIKNLNNMMNHWNKANSLNFLEEKIDQSPHTLAEPLVIDV